MRAIRYIPFLNMLSYSRYSYSSLLPTNKICRDCKFYIANNKECGRFPNVNIVTGTKSYDYAFRLRNDETRCGTEAKYFEQNNYKIITAPYYFFLSWWPVLIFPISIALQCIILTK